MSMKIHVAVKMMHKSDVFTWFSFPIPSMFNLTGHPKVQCLHSGILLSSPQARLGVVD